MDPVYSQNVLIWIINVVQLEKLNARHQVPVQHSRSLQQQRQNSGFKLRAFSVATRADEGQEPSMFCKASDL